MSADLYAWEPSLNLKPRGRDFETRVERLNDPQNREPPTKRMRQFVTALTRRYPELDDNNAGITAWADGPLIGDVCGKFINVTIVWNMYDEARGYFLDVAAELGLNAYDPQDDTFHPAIRGSPSAALSGLVGAMVIAANPLVDRRTLLGGGIGLLLPRPW